MIADEIQSGLARSGKLLACDWEEVRPDVVVSFQYPFQFLLTFAYISWFNHQLSPLICFCKKRDFFFFYIYSNFLFSDTRKGIGWRSDTCQRSSCRQRCNALYPPWRARKVCSLTIWFALPVP